MTTKLQTIIHILQTVPVFAQSRVADLELLARSIKYIYATRKEILYRQGDPCEGFHVIVYGRIKMSLMSWNVCVQPIHIADRGIGRIVSTDFEVDTCTQRWRRRRRGGHVGGTIRSSRRK